MRILRSEIKAGYEKDELPDTMNNSSPAFLNSKPIIMPEIINQAYIYQPSIDKFIHIALNSVEDSVIKNNKSLFLELDRNDILKVESDLLCQHHDQVNSIVTHANFRKYLNGKSTLLESCAEYLEKVESNCTLDTNYEIENQLFEEMDHSNKNMSADNISMENNGNPRSLESIQIGETNKIEEYMYDIYNYSSLNCTNKYDDEENSNGIISASNSDDSKRSYFVRGIINPNYPGFQHLAYTLTEHIISVPFSESCNINFSEGNEESGLTNPFLKPSTSKFGLKMGNKSLAAVPHKNNNYIFRNILDKNFRCPKPDILLKNCNSLDKNVNNSQNPPDLIQNVNQKLENKLGNPDIQLENDFKIIVKNESTPDSLSNNAWSGNFVSNDMTPVDIIGNFEQEVEHEFGRLVNGYSSLINECIQEKNKIEHFTLISEKMHCNDATLSNGIENMESKKLVNVIKKTKIKDEYSLDHSMNERRVISPTFASKTQKFKYFKEDNLDQINDSDIDYLLKYNPLIDNLIEEKNVTELMNSDLQNKGTILLPRYKKKLYDDRQLPLVGIDYKCNQSPTTRPSRKSKTSKVQPNTLKCSLNQTFPQAKRSPQRHLSQVGNCKDTDLDMDYHQLISAERELILSASRYSKMAFWALHLNSSADKDKENAVQNAVKYGKSSHADLKHYEKKDFEKNSRYKRDEIRRRLAFEVYDDHFGQLPTIKRNTIQKGKFTFPSSFLKCEMLSDNESHSSDSETCPKLSKEIQKKNINRTNSGIKLCYNTEDIECDFFAKQSRLQLQARIALAQAKDMAHIQMEIDKQKLRSSPITDFIRISVEKVGIQIPSTTRRVSRKLLTDMNITQLQVIVNDLHSHIEDLNDILVQYLTERDDLYLKQDTILVDIEDLSRYLGATEKSSKLIPKHTD